MLTDLGLGVGYNKVEVTPPRAEAPKVPLNHVSEIVRSVLILNKYI